MLRETLDHLGEHCRRTARARQVVVDGELHGTCVMARDLTDVTYQRPTTTLIATSAASMVGV